MPRLQRDPPRAARPENSGQAKERRAKERRRSALSSMCGKLRSIAIILSVLDGIAEEHVDRRMQSRRAISGGLRSADMRSDGLEHVPALFVGTSCAMR